MSRTEPPLLTLDVVVLVLSKTLFSPFFCIWIPPTLAGRLKEWSHPVVIYSAAWAAVLLLKSITNYVNRVYSAGGSWFFLPTKLKWEDQIVVITGGGSGIGALLAETLSLRNVTVVVLTKYPPVQPFEGDNVHTFICDVSDWKAVEETAEKVRTQVGDPTIIVNNAGVVKGKLLLDLTEEDVKDTFGVNTLAHFWILKAFLPFMLRANKGHIVTMSSLMGLVGAAQSTDYCASKAALISLHHSLTHELSTRLHAPKIRTTLVLPSFTRTSLFSKVHMPSDPPSSPSISSRLNSLSYRFFAFFAPPLDPHEIVKAIISTLDADESAVLRLPFYSHVGRFMGPGIGIVPRWMGDAVQWVTGADWAMRDYGPKPDAGDRILAERAGESMESDNAIGKDSKR